MFPLIYTSRLELRPALSLDCDILTNLWNEEDVKKFFWDGKCITTSQVHEELDFCKSSFKEYGIGHWIITIENKTAIGSIGLLTYQDPFFDREILKKEAGMVELIFAVFPNFRRLGLVTEATKAIIR